MPMALMRYMVPFEVVNEGWYFLCKKGAEKRTEKYASGTKERRILKT